MIVLKREEEIEKMYKVNQIVGEAILSVKEELKNGISTYDIDRLIEEFIVKKGAKPAFKGYNGFPNSSCISINEEIVHGIPSKKIILKEGDIVSIDVGAYLEGYYGDSARTYGIGEIAEKAKALLKITYEALEIAISSLKEAKLLGEVSNSVQKYVESQGYSIIRDYVGHGIGKNLHEEPQVPNFGTRLRGPRIAKGMTLALEPMVSVGDWAIEILEDGWTAVTADRSLSAHYEDTVAVTERGVKNLSRIDGIKDGPIFEVR